MTTLDQARSPLRTRPERLRVGILTPPWLPVPPVGYGGTENVVDVLVRGLAAAGHEPFLFATGDSACGVERAWCFERALGIGGGGVEDELAQVATGYAALSAAGVDLVHDHTWSGPVYAAAFSDLPVVTTVHGRFRPELAKVYEALAGRVDVVAISADQASYAPAGAVAAVVHHGVDLECFPVGAGRGGYALFLGRAHPDKGVAEAIAAARSAGVPLRIAARVTEEVEERYFETCIAPQIGGDVEYLGEVDTPRKLELLGDAVCLLNPIKWSEPFGMVMIEALACGTPVVATGYGSVREIVEDGVTGFVREGTAGLAGGVLAAGGLDRARCRRAVEERFSSARMVADYLSVYRSALGARRPQGRAGRWEGATRALGPLG